MKRGLGLLASALALTAAVAASAPREALAQGRGSSAPKADADEAKSAEQLEALEHFQRARELYEAGSYREAIGELEAARALDPAAKDLVFNLGKVHEKLGRFDEAITLFREYLQMPTVTADERTKAEAYLKRLEGAKREASPEAPSEPTPAATTPPPTTDEHADRPHGRVDAATITAGSIALVGLGVGATFGILALSTRPSDGFVTGRDGSYAELEAKTNDARTQAIVADVGLGVGLVAAAVTAYLYFGRERDKDPKAAVLRPSAGPLPGGGGAVALGGYWP